MLNNYKEKLHSVKKAAHLLTAVGIASQISCAQSGEQPQSLQQTPTVFSEGEYRYQIKISAADRGYIYMFSDQEPQLESAGNGVILRAKDVICPREPRYKYDKNRFLPSILDELGCKDYSRGIIRYTTSEVTIFDQSEAKK